MVFNLEAWWFYNFCITNQPSQARQKNICVLAILHVLTYSVCYTMLPRAKYFSVNTYLYKFGKSLCLVPRPPFLSQLTCFGSCGPFIPDPRGATCRIHDRGVWRRNVILRTPKNTWAWSFTPKKIPDIKIFYQKIKDLVPQIILIYSIKQTLRRQISWPKKNTEGINFQPKKIRRTSPSCLLQVPPPPPPLPGSQISHQNG